MSKRIIVAVQKFDKQIIAEFLEGQPVPAAAAKALRKGDAVLMAEFAGAWREFTKS